MAVTLPLLSCLGEAKRSPHSPLALQGNDGLPLCVQRATQWITQPRGWGFCSGPQAHAQFGLKSLPSWSLQILSPPYLPTPPPMVHMSPVLASILTAATQDCGQGSPYSHMSSLQCPWRHLLTPFTGCRGLDLRFGNVYLFEL